MELMLFNGILLLKDKGLATSRKCCCYPRSKWCVTYIVNYATIARRYVVDLADQQFVPPPVGPLFWWPEGKPCDPFCSNGTAFGYFENFTSGPNRSCGCGGNPPGTEWRAVDIGNVTDEVAAARCPPINPPAGGPGTELKKLLSWFNIRSTPDCQCDDRALLMDVLGADECEERLDEIVGWLEEEAAERGLPFIRSLAELAVKQAIRNSRRQEPEPDES
jgi:hypothetical protein